MKKGKILSLILTLVLVCSMSVMMFVGCNGSGGKDDKAVATSYVALDINPSVELILDQDNKVMSVRGLNEDANVMLYGEKGIVGADVNVAVEKIGKLSSDLKYVNDENQAVNITVSSSLDTAAGNALKSNLEVNLKKGTGVELKFNYDGNFSLQREYKAFLDKYKDEIGQAQVTIEQYRLMAEAMAADASLKVKDLVNKTQAELIEVVSDVREDVIDATINMLPKAERAALETISNAYDFAVEKLETGAYLDVAIRNEVFGKIIGITELDNILDQIGYIAYENIALALEDIHDAIEVAFEKTEEVINKEEVKAVLQKLVDEGIIDGAKLDAEVAKVDANKDNKYTLDELDAYIDIKLKNAGKELTESFEKALDDAMDTLEDKFEEAKKNIPPEVQAKIDELSTKLTAEITKHIDMEKLGALKTQIEGAIKTAVNKVINFNAAKDIPAAIEDAQEIAEEEAEKFEDNIKKFFDKKDENLMKKVDEYKANVRNNEELKSIKAELDEAVKTYSAKANEYLAAQKEARKNN